MGISLPHQWSPQTDPKKPRNKVPPRHHWGFFCFCLSGEPFYAASFASFVLEAPKLGRCLAHDMHRHASGNGGKLLFAGPVGLTERQGFER